jgi:hypothetical protein
MMICGVDGIASAGEQVTQSASSAMQMHWVNFLALKLPL